MALQVVDIGPLGPLIQVGIRAGTAFEAIGRGGAPHSYTALIDTGASRSTISRRVVVDVQPQSAGSTSLTRAGAAPLTIKRYEIRLKFQSHLAPDRWFDLMVVETTPATPGVDVLIGQDLLLQLTLLYNGPLGKLVLMY
jgi:Retroviral aspartyl protease